MHVHGLKIPALLVELIEAGVWPGSSEEAVRQNITPIVSTKVASRVSPGEDQIILTAPPFQTIHDDITNGSGFWTKDLTNVGEIDYSRAIVIADFGLGSDSPIILYYTRDDQSPVVMYLSWQGDGPVVAHKWLQTHGSFNQFAAEIRLGR